MTPTYSFSEIKCLVKTLDDSSIHILHDLIDEEKECFTSYQLTALRRFLQLKHKSVIINEVNMEFLLSFN